MSYYTYPIPPVAYPVYPPVRPPFAGGYQIPPVYAPQFLPPYGPQHGSHYAPVYGGYGWPKKSQYHRPDEYGKPPPVKCAKDANYKWNEQNNSVGSRNGCTSDCQCSGTRVCDMRFGTWGYCQRKNLTGLAS